MDIKHNYSLKPHNTFGLNAFTKEFISVSNEHDIHEIIQQRNITNENLLILGDGSNILFKGDYDGVILKSNLLKINVTEYDWNENYTGYDFLKERLKLHSIGMIAQEINLLYPEVVYRRDDGYLAIKYYKLNALIIEAIKSQQVFIEDIEEQINWLRTQID